MAMKFATPARPSGPALALLRAHDNSFALFGKSDMSSKPKSFREFSLECKSAQRSIIRRERERMDKAEVLWREYFLAFSALGPEADDGP
jgi:hypothetical protein